MLVEAQGLCYVSDFCTFEYFSGVQTISFPAKFTEVNSAVSVAKSTLELGQLFIFTLYSSPCIVLLRNLVKKEIETVLSMVYNPLFSTSQLFIWQIRNLTKFVWLCDDIIIWLKI